MQMHIRKDDITQSRVVDTPVAEPGPGEIRVRIDRFGYSANNVTYAAAGDTLNYWKFFPTAEDGWGLVPVWGFADVEISNCEGIAVGERLFGYFPPASTLILAPTGLQSGHFIDGTPHRAELPVGYNVYRRVKKQDRDTEDRHMLLFPLYLTSWCLWDALKQAEWHGAERVIIASASSKTAIGTAFAIMQDNESPPLVGLTSRRNVDFVESLGLYDSVMAYDDIEDLDADHPAVIVDMSGNAEMLGQLHTHLGDAMRHTLDVGLTHWEAPRSGGGRNRERSTFFFAPAHVQARTTEWGARAFADRTQEFMQAATQDSRRWLMLETVAGLAGLNDLHPKVAAGESDAAAGFIVEM